MMSSSGSVPAGTSSSAAASGALTVANGDIIKIKELLPGDTSARTDLLLNLLKTSYTSSMHSADVRLSALTQEVASLRAQNTYLESKLKSLESLADAAGKATEEQKKRNEQLTSENVRFKAENQQLKAENEQLNNFKSILMSAASGMAPSPTNGLLSATIQTQRFGVPDPSLPYAASTLSTADLDYKPSPSPAPVPIALSTNIHAAPLHTNPSFYFSPLKRPHESIAIGNMQPHAIQQAQPQPTAHVSVSGNPHATPYTKRSGNSGYVHVMPSPLTADALASPPPQPAPNATNQHNGNGHGNDILNEINANLSSSRGRPSHSPTRPTSHSGSSSSFPSLSPPVASSFSSSGSSLVSQARGLFHSAQSRLAPNVFAEFVTLVQQFRSAAGAGAQSEHAWDEIRYKAATLLAGHQELFMQFEQLLQATQNQR